MTFPPLPCFGPKSVTHVSGTFLLPMSQAGHGSVKDQVEWLDVESWPEFSP